jgi:hypothetical protein
VGYLNQQPGNKGPRQSSRQRIDALIDGIGLQGWKDELVDKGIPHIHHQRLDGTHLQRLLLHCRKVLVRAHVGGDGDDVHAVLLFDPSDGG